MTQTKKPTLKVVGTDGNAFALLGKAKQAASKAGWDAAKTSAMMTEAMAGDYNHLLATLMEHFDVE